MTDTNPQEFCCERCFEHPWLRAVAGDNAETIGRCFYCENTATLTRLARFREGFENLLSDYIWAEHANGGHDTYLASVPAIDAIQRDWKLFSVHCSREKLNEFLPAMFKPDLLPRIGNFDVPVVPFHRNAMSTAFGRWPAFWFIDPRDISGWTSGDPQSEIGTIGSMAWQQADHLKHFVHPMEAGRRLWRARDEYVGSSKWDCEPLPIDQMGHNPACLASRLNSPGEVVLYTAEAERTALAEIRPGRGYICTTCEMRTVRNLRVLDLASALVEVNPFTQLHLTWQLDLQRIARNLSGTIAQPISRSGDLFVYGRTQYLARLVRAMGLEGIRFPSSLDSPNGVNVALFDTSSVSRLSTNLVAITSAKIEYESIEPQRLSHPRS